MANSPKQATITVEGELVLRLKDGTEHVMGVVELELPVTLHYVPSAPTGQENEG